MYLAAPFTMVTMQVAGNGDAALRSRPVRAFNSAWRQASTRSPILATTTGASVVPSGVKS